jgi:hypothetical protein
MVHGFYRLVIDGIFDLKGRSADLRRDKRDIRLS